VRDVGRSAKRLRRYVARPRRRVQRFVLNVVAVILSVGVLRSPSTTTTATPPQMTTTTTTHALARFPPPHFMTTSGTVSARLSKRRGCCQFSEREGVRTRVCVRQCVSVLCVRACACASACACACVCVCSSHSQTRNTRRPEQQKPTRPDHRSSSTRPVPTADSRNTTKKKSNNNNTKKCFSFIYTKAHTS
jgi:hypothetical protein